MQFNVVRFWNIGLLFFVNYSSSPHYYQETVLFWEQLVHVYNSILQETVFLLHNTKIKWKYNTSYIILNIYRWCLNTVKLSSVSKQHKGNGLQIYTVVVMKKTLPEFTCVTIPQCSGSECTVSSKKQAKKKNNLSSE